MEIKLKVGDKVITADGRTGKVINGDNGALWARLDDDSYEKIIDKDGNAYYDNFYLVGKNFFGNKINVADMERRVEEQRAICQAENAKLDILRKQLWTLNERMVPDWKERLANKKAKQKQNSETE